MVPRCSYSTRFRMMVLFIKHGMAHQAPTICSTGPDKSSIKSARTRNPGGLDYKTVTGRNRQSAVHLNERPTTYAYLQPIPKLPLIGFCDKLFVSFIARRELALFVPDVDMVYFAIMLPF